MGLFDFVGGSPRDRFARRVMKRLRDIGWEQYQVELDRKRFALRFRQGGEIPLEPEFQETAGDPPADGPGFDALMARLFDPGPSRSFEESAPALRPVLLHRSMLEGARLTERTEPQHWPGAGLAVLQILGGHFIFVAAIDHPPTSQLRLAADVAAWGVPREALLARAVDNLRDRPLRFEPAEQGFLLSFCEDPYHAARLLMPELFTGLGLKGAPVVVPMMSERIAVAGADDAEALLAMAQFAEATVRGDGRAFGFGPLVLGADGWRPFEPEAPVLRPLCDLWRLQRSWDYAAVDQALGPWLARADGPFVAEFRCFVPEDRPVTLAIWRQIETPALLPMADAILFEPRHGPMFARDWAEVAAHVALEPEPDLWPDRVRARSWPDPAALDALMSRPAPSWWSANKAGAASGQSGSG